MPHKHLVLFDIDGTLLHSGGCGRAASRLATLEVFGTIGILDDVNFAGKTDWQILLEALIPANISGEHIQQRLDIFNQVVAHHLAAIIADFPVRPCAGAPEVVAALCENPAVVIGIVTGNMAGLVPIKLRQAGYDPGDFKVGAFGSEGWKRSMLPPLALERAQTHSGGTFAPERIVIIGDTPNDITCAESIQARTLAVATGPFSVDALRSHQPTHLFDTLADTGAVLSAILQNGHV
ncbi:MAG: HAD hydrolase-like protein [Anaerolineae bacterium]|nr:HAD hydrolase-like protein [Anaerolineae bacterium]